MSKNKLAAKPIIHFRNTARQLLKTLKAKGFNGVRFLRLELEGSDKPEPGEQTWDQLREQNRNYAIFVAQPDLDASALPDDKNEYLEVELHIGKFLDDFMKMLKNTFPGAKIRYSAGCHEYEVTAPKRSRQ